MHMTSHTSARQASASENSAQSDETPSCDVLYPYIHNTAAAEEPTERCTEYGVHM